MTKPPSPRPLGIKLIVFLYFFATANCLASLGNEFLFNLFEGLMFLVLGFGLWRLGELSRRVTIGFELFNIAHTIFAWLECPRTNCGTIGVWDSRGAANRLVTPPQPLTPLPGAATVPALAR